jgi:Na+/melibiose symporter-like transporter
MKSRNALFSLILLLDIVLTACGGAPTPDVIEWDELCTRRRQEGIYYGIKNFVRKMTGALAIFITLQVLGWVVY